MENGQSLLLRARFYSSVLAIYVVILLLLGYALKPYIPEVFNRKTPPVYQVPALVRPIESTPEKEVTVGRPIRIVIPSATIDLPIEDGIYNSDSGGWTLGAKTAHYAHISAPANDKEGNTFIYGHNNPYVFGPIINIKPGAEALIYTTNDHVFRYVLTSSEDFNPNDTSVFSYEGPPRLTIQTCVGSWFELRRMYYFDLKDVQ